MTDRYDMVVVGGGTAGLVSSMIAAGIGARVALVEGDRTGGDCLWTGCVPSKSLLAAAHLAHRMRHAESVGLTPVEPQIDAARVMERVRGVIAAIEPHDSPARLRAEGIDVIPGHGRFIDERTLDVDGRRLRFRTAIIATGSRPVIPPVPGLADASGLLTTDTVWDIREFPRRLVVLGGGPIGCELSQAFARLGSQVVTVEMADRLLLKEEPAASALIADRLVQDGVDVRLDTRAVEARSAADGTPELIVEGPHGSAAIPLDNVLVATGRRPRTDDLGLAAAGVDTDQRGAVVVDARLRTSASHIYAAGDVTALLPFTHVAAHHARVATINALFHTRRKTETEATIPWVTFTDPEVARVGLSEAQALERWGDRTVITVARYTQVDRALTDGESRGFAQLIGDARGRLVGATVAAQGAGEVIAELAARVARGDKIDAVSSAVHAYPTLAEGPARAADALLRERYSNPRYRAAAKPILAAMRRISRT